MAEICHILGFWALIGKPVGLNVEGRAEAYFRHFASSAVLLTDVFFDFQFCEYRILDFMEVEHIVLKQSLSINRVFYMKHTKVQYSHSFSDTL